MPAASRNIRGSSYDRRRRREWLVEQHGIPRKRDGAKTRLPCHHCRKIMMVDGPFEVDRFPVCGHDGGRYTRDNIVASCVKCNKNRCTTAKNCRKTHGRPSYYADALSLLPVEEKSDEIPF
jgi:hypothetical protein